MNKYFQLLFRVPKDNIVLAKLRERLLRMMLISSTIMGTMLYAIAVIPVLQKGLYSTILLYGVLFLWIILVTFLPRLPYRVRAISWLSLLYILGSVNLLMSGFNVDAGLFLITFIAMAILLMDLQGGMVALVLSSVTVSLSGFINVNEHFPLSMGLSQSNPLLWIIGGIIFLLMGMLLISSLTIVVHGLANNLTKSNLLAEELEQTNQSLRMSEAHYRTLVETSPGLVAVLDVDGNIMMANQVGLELFGYEHLEEVAGKNMMVFIAPDDRLNAAEAFQNTLKMGEQKDIEFLAIKKDGNSFIAEFSTKVVMDEAGKALAVIGVGKDITERREAEQLLREAKEALAEKVVETTVQLKQTTGRLDELVKYAPIVVFSFQPEEHVITYISENVSALLGYEASSFTEDNNFWSDHV
ncbi:MAG TPA: PAS domain S-box protein, partial [Geobacteraceae bacterium]|nr:PAS domain S-box protein [Geobacteraceae bacterium]